MKLTFFGNQPSKSGSEEKEIKMQDCSNIRVMHVIQGEEWSQ